VLRIEGQDEDPIGAFQFQGVERARDGGLTVAHRVADGDRMTALAEVAAEQQRLLFGPDSERRSFRHPDAGVPARRARWPQAQDDAVQQRQPEQARDLDDARVAQKLRKIAAHGARRRRIGCSEVAQQHDRLRCRSVCEGWLGREAHWTPTLAADAATLPPQGAFAPWGGPAALIESRLEAELERSLPLGIGELHHFEADARADRLGRRRAEADHAAAVQRAGTAAQADDLRVVVEADVGAVVAEVGELERATVPV